MKYSTVILIFIFVFTSCNNSEKEIQKRDIEIIKLKDELKTKDLLIKGLIIEINKSDSLK